MTDKNKIYLIVPSEDGADVNMVVDHTLENQGKVGDWMAKSVFGVKRAEVTVDAEAVQNQVNKYIAIVRELANSTQGEPSNGIHLSEIKLNLTLSAKGNIGIASTSAEAGIELVFKRH